MYKYKQHLIVTLMLYAHFPSNAMAHDLTNKMKTAVSVLSFQIPVQLSMALRERFPNAIILAHSTLCLDQDSQIGIILYQKDRLHAVLAVETEHRYWEVNDLNTSVEYTYGGMGDFLQDFYDGNVETMEVRCTVPNMDKDITVSANGEFLNGFQPRKEGDDADFGNHVCFSTSDVYNSWACYRANHKTHKPVLSFVQMNAD